MDSSQIKLQRPPENAAVLCKGTYIFALPGSSGAVTDAWEDILKYQLDSRFEPCNFINLIPRLKEK